MSRIGKQPILLPEGVSCKIEDGLVVIKGQKGELKQKIKDPRVSVKLVDGKILVERLSEAKQVKALHGLYRALINNMVIGTTKGFEKELVLHGVGWKTSMEGTTLKLLVGYSHPVFFSPPAGITISTEKEKIKVSGIDKELVGEVAAKIRRVRPVEPYKGKGIRYSNEYVRRKVGKTGVK
ncbi:TPA: 50S ribosomal protein L6 [bacterium]|nr:50S ribosomal protein L6 [bacterium]